MTRASSLPQRARLALGLSALVFGMSACSGDSGPGEEAELVNALTSDDTFTEAEAECIAEVVFDEYGDDEEALKLITRTADYETLTGDGEESVEGFGEFFDNAIKGCTL